jgi:hypothetical protein
MTRGLEFLQVAGAAAGAAGGAMILAGAMYGTTLGPAGVIVGVIGGVLVAGGFVVAAWLSHNANQTFANRCFLGESAGKASSEVDWSAKRLPTMIAPDEAAALIDLMSQFQLSGRADLGDWWLDIHPGYVEPGWKFDVDIVLTWGKDSEVDRGVRKRNERRYKIEVPLSEGSEPKQVSGLRLSPEHRILRDVEGRVEAIAINLEEAVRPPNEVRQFQGVAARVRLLGEDSKQRVPYEGGDAVKLGLPGSTRASSMDSSSWLMIDGAATP